jgi:hypothetical protein
MRTTNVATAGHGPPRWRLDDSRGLGVGPRRGELAAGLATAAIAGQLLFAPVVLLGATAMVAVGRVSRWRPAWLAAATAASVIWLSASGPLPAVAAFAAGSRHLAGFLLAAAIHPRMFAHPGLVAPLASARPAMSLLVAAVAACGEAWLVLWLGWWRPGARSRWVWRPGLVAAARRRMSAAALRAGHTVTSDGCAVGVATETGKLASFTWADARHGVLLTGEDRDVCGLAITCAALRRRKTVVMLGCTSRSAGAGGYGDGAAVTDRVGRLARSLGVPVTVAAADSAAPAIGRAIRRREAVLVAAPTVSQDADAVRRAVADLTAVLSGLRDLGLRADCLTWLDGVEHVNPASVRELLALAPLTGTSMVLSTADSAAAGQLATTTAVLAIGPPVGIDLELALAARLLGRGGAPGFTGRESARGAQAGAADATWRTTKQDRRGGVRPGRVTMIVASLDLDGTPRATRHCRLQPITLADSS